MVDLVQKFQPAGVNVTLNKMSDGIAMKCIGPVSDYHN